MPVPSKISDALEPIAFAGVAVSVGALAGAWWGALVGFVLLGVYAYLLDDAPSPPGAS